MVPLFGLYAPLLSASGFAIKRKSVVDALSAMSFTAFNCSSVAARLALAKSAAVRVVFCKPVI